MIHGSGQHGKYANQLFSAFGCLWRFSCRKGLMFCAWGCNYIGFRLRKTKIQSEKHHDPAQEGAALPERYLVYYHSPHIHIIYWSVAKPWMNCTRGRTNWKIPQVGWRYLTAVSIVVGFFFYYLSLHHSQQPTGSRLHFGTHSRTSRLIVPPHFRYSVAPVNRKSIWWWKSDDHSRLHRRISRQRVTNSGRTVATITIWCCSRQMFKLLVSFFYSRRFFHFVIFQALERT